MPVAPAQLHRIRRRAQKGGRVASPPAVFGGRTGLWIAGVDYTALLRAHSPVIRSTSYAQTGVFSFTLHGHVPSVPAEQTLIRAVTVEQDVNWNVGGVIYGGLVRAITPEDRNRTDYLVINVECQDYTALLAGSICAYSNPYTNPLRSVVETDAQRISWLLQSYDRYGISAQHVQALTAALAPQDFTGMSLTDAIKAVLAFGNGSFYVDVFKDLHTFTSEVNAAPFALADVPDNVTSFGFTGFTYPSDSVDLQNAVYVIPGTPDAATLAVDSVAISVTPNMTDAAVVLASFKVLRRPSLLAAGPVKRVVASPVTPALGLPTSAGNLLVAYVVNPTAADIATTSPGWVQAGASAVGPSSETASVWYKLNCAANEAPPTFTSSTSLIAQLAEFLGTVVSSALDQSATGSGSLASAPVSATMATLDQAFGELVISSAALFTSSAGPGVFTELFGNNVAFQARVGDSGAESQTRHVCFSYAITGPAPTWYTDEASIATYGRREASITNPAVTTQAGLNLLGAAYIAAHKAPLRHCSLKCWQAGLTAGMSVNVTNALYGLVAQPFRIQGLTITYPVDTAPLFDVQFADQPVTLATQMNAVRLKAIGT